MYDIRRSPDFVNALLMFPIIQDEPPPMSLSAVNKKWGTRLRPRDNSGKVIHPSGSQTSVCFFSFFLFSLHCLVYV